MTSATCFITGTTHGIGRITAEAIAERGFTVVMGCRDLHRGQLVRDEIVDQTGNESVYVLPCDLASLASVRACADAFFDDFDNLELLINNAGLMTSRFQTSAEGLELSFAANYLGPYLLTRLLLPALQRTGQPARIVNVASKVHASGSIDLDAIDAGESAQGFSGMRAYARSKLANVMFTLSLAERLADTKVTANCLHPGVVATNITAATNTFLRVGMKLAAPFMFSQRRGTATSLYLALDPELASVNGQYFNEHQRPVRPAPAALDPQARDALWRWSANVCGFEDSTTRHRPVHNQEL